MLRYFTVELTSRPLARLVTNEDLEAWAVAVDEEERLAAAVTGADRSRNAVDVIACVDVQEEDLARETAIAAFRLAAARAGLGAVDVASIVLTPDGSEPEELDDDA